MEFTDVNCPLPGNVSRRLNVYKLLLTVLVVYIHANASGANFASGAVTVPDPLWLQRLRFFLSNGVARAAVPGFFLTSAVLLYRKPFSWKENMAKKLRTLGLPYLILNTLWIAAFFGAQQIPGVRNFFSNPDKIIGSWGLKDWVNAYLGFAAESPYPFLYPLWFVRDLLVLNLLASLLGQIIDRFPNVSLGLALAAWLLSWNTGIFCIDAQGICFWILGGVLVKKEIALEWADRIPAALSAGVYLALLWLTMAVDWQIVRQLMILTGVVFWFQVTALVRSHRVMDALGKLSAFSFGIYLFHEFFLTLARKAAVKLLPLTPVSQLLQYLLIPAAVVVLCIAICMVLKKWFPRLYGLLTGGRG